MESTNSEYSSDLSDPFYALMNKQQIPMASFFESILNKWRMTDGVYSSPQFGSL